jgi:hypothetical protein
VCVPPGGRDDFPLDDVVGAAAVHGRPPTVAAALREAAGGAGGGAVGADDAVAEAVGGAEGVDGEDAGAQFESRAGVCGTAVVQDRFDGVHVVRPDPDGPFAGALTKCAS